MKKIIKQKGRLILIEKELDKMEYWRGLLDSLTFAEGMAFAQAMQEWSKKYNLSVVEGKKWK